MRYNADVCWKAKFYEFCLDTITSHHITFISPRIYKNSCIANFSEKEQKKKPENMNKNKIVDFIQYINLYLHK